MPVASLQLVGVRPWLLALPATPLLACAKARLKTSGSMGDGFLEVIGGGVVAG